MSGGGRYRDPNARRVGPAKHTGINKHLPVPCINAAGEVVRVRKALNASVFADGKDPVFVGVDDRAIMRLGSANNGRHDVAPCKAAKAGIRTAIGARIAAQ
eukprot:scaffold7958_cov133-Isochrysis_galbana.AAC.10